MPTGVWRCGAASTSGRSRAIEEFNEPLEANFDVHQPVPTWCATINTRFVLGAAFVSRLTAAIQRVRRHGRSRLPQAFRLTSWTARQVVAGPSRIFAVVLQ